MAQPYPIVFIRGYAMTEREVEDTFNRPYYGFEAGSTQVKLGSDAKPEMYIFESPIIRLIKEEGYTDSFNRFVDWANNPIASSVAGVDWRKTLWIFRFYDREAKLFAQEKRQEIEGYAAQLAIFLNRVRAACAPTKPDDFRVNLVAHSMGGLIARCYLQKTDLFEGRYLPQERTLNDEGSSHIAINKLFTYGTPHRGISFREGFGWIETVRDFVGYKGADTFGEVRMREFLSLPDEDLATLNTTRPDLLDPFGRATSPAKRVFCMVGTNYKDYELWLSKKSVGPASDGLVAIENAYVKDAARAYVHRAHSGPFGLVNSEEGYQNLTRFLFGDWRVEIYLDALKVNVEGFPGLTGEDTLNFLEVNVDVAVRGLPSYLNSARDRDQSAIIVRMTRNYDGNSYCYVQADPRPVHLFTAFLRTNRMPQEEMSNDNSYMHAAVNLRIMPHFVRPKKVLRDTRFEGESILSNRLHIGIGVESPYEVKYRWSLERKERTETEGTGDFKVIPPSIGIYEFEFPKDQSYVTCKCIRAKPERWT
jgi:hypothetical protein